MITMLEAELCLRKNGSCLVLVLVVGDDDRFQGVCVSLSLFVSPIRDDKKSSK